MKILHLRNSDLLGGPERLILAQVKFGSPESEHHVASFVRGSERGTFLDAASKAGATVHAIPQRSSYDRSVIAKVRGLVVELGPHIVIGHDYKADLVARRALHGLGVPLMAMAHGYTGENLKIRLFERMDRRALRSFAHVIAVSEGVETQLRKAGVAAERITVVPNGIDIERVAERALAGRDALRSEWRIGEDERVLLFLGRLSPEKGPEILLESFQALHAAHAGLRLVFVGDGALRTSLEAAAAKLPPGAVQFAGWRDDPSACLGASDVFVLSSRREGLPLALLEAMAAERPIVATRVGGVPEALADGACGMLVPPADPLGLTAALETVLGDEAGRGERVARAKQRVVEQFSASSQVRRIEALYRRVAGQPIA